MLTVSGLTDTAKAMSLNYTLETFTFRSADDVNKCSVIKQFNGYGITQIQFCFKFFELSQVFLGSYSGLFEMAHQRLRRMLFFLFLKAQLNGCIAVFFYGLHLSNYTRTCFDNSAWYILTLGTENGCHSDFFS